MIDTARPAATKQERICVAIPTFRRPEQLATLLDALAAQARLPDIYLNVLVIDNDKSPSSRAVVASRRERFPFELTYEHAPEPGLSSVRNFALERARAGFDALAMIDDDERPEPLWLRELLRIQRQTRADVVIGPVVHLIPESAPRWLRRTKLYRLPAVADGAAIEFGYSGNCLLRVASLDRFGVTFDKELNFAGGEDMFFFRQLVARGAKMAFAAQALAFEPVERDRLSVDYLLRLHFRRGNTLSLCDRRLNGSARGLFVRAAKGTARVLLGVLGLLPLLVVRGREGAVEALGSVAAGLGSLTGLFGHVYQAYKRVD
jgi:glycosyltransferase involved in cell wall biosynthesis